MRATTASAGPDYDDFMDRRSFLLVAAGASVAAWAAPALRGAIAFVRQDGLWVKGLAAGEATNVVAGGVKRPRFSPSGQWIAYASPVRQQVADLIIDRGDMLHIVSRDGQQDIALDSGSWQWHPTKDEILMEADGGLTVFTAANGWKNSTQVIAHATLPLVFSPDGIEIAYADAIDGGRGPGGEAMRTSRLCHLALNTPGASPRILVTEYLQGYELYLWTRYDTILFWKDPDFSASVRADGLELFSVSAAGGAARSLGVSNLVHEDMVSLSPSGEALTVSCGSGREVLSSKRIAVVNLKTGVIDYLTDRKTAAVAPSWSPDGKRIAYSAAPAGEWGSGEEARQLLTQRRIWVIDASGAQTSRPLTHDNRYRDEEPMWSADGEHILFCRIDSADQKTVWTMRADGSEPTQVAGPLYIEPGILRVNGTWLGFYGYIDWRKVLDWHPGNRL
jgi:dipeptidyl aminopeptidase/acylaminoacyl peptidase